MSEKIWIRSHIRQLLHEIWGDAPVRLDEDGDVAFRCGSAACWVTVLDSDPPMVRVFAHATYGVRSTAKLRTELNEIQRRALSARVDLLRDMVVVSQTLSPIELTAPVLHQALDAVGFLASEVGPLLAAMFNGEVPSAGDGAELCTPDER